MPGAVDWIDIRDAVPDNRERVLTWRPGGAPRFSMAIHIYHRDYCESGESWWIGVSCWLVSDGDITHWATLPAGPGNRAD